MFKDEDLDLERPPGDIFRDEESKPKISLTNSNQQPTNKTLNEYEEI